MTEVDSNKLNSKIGWVCLDCGIEALKLRENAGKRQFSISTWHTGTCDVCQEKKPVTETRDFDYPVFNIKK